MLRRAPIFNTSLPEKIQPVKWHFSSRGNKPGRRRLPPLQQDSGAAQAEVSGDATSSPPPGLNRKRSLEKTFALYGQDMPPMPAHGRREQPRQPASLQAASLDADERGLPPNRQAGTGEAHAEWDDVASMEDMDWIDPDAEACTPEETLQAAEEDCVADLVGRLMLGDEVPPAAPRSGPAAHSVASRSGYQQHPIVHEAASTTPCQPAEPSSARLHVQVAQAAPQPAQSLKASPSASSLGSRNASPPPRALPHARSADWAVAKELQGRIDRGLPRDSPTNGHRNMAQAIPFQPHPPLMPTLDELLAGKARGTYVRRHPRQQDSIPRMPHSAR